MERTIDSLVKLTISITGMRCGRCVERIDTALAAVPGVQTGSVRVGEAKVTFDGCAVTKGEIFAAIRAAGNFDVDAFAAL